MTNVIKVIRVLMMSMMMVLLKNDGKAWRVWSTPVPQAAGELCPAQGKRQTNPSTEFHLWNYHHKMISLFEKSSQIINCDYHIGTWPPGPTSYCPFSNNHYKIIIIILFLMNRLFIREIQLLIVPYNWHDNLWRRCPWKWLSPASAFDPTGPSSH